jgi:tetratricopeptide (TPR) repeat protein
MAGKRRTAALGGCLLVLALGVGDTRVLAVDVEDLTGSAVTGVGPYRQDVQDAIQAFAARDYRTALARLQNAKKVTPALAPGEVMMAMLHFDAGQPLPAIAMLEKAIQTAPSDPEAYVLLTERAIGEGRLTEADLLYEKMIKVVEPFNQSPRRRQNLLRRAYTAGAAIDEAKGQLDAAQAKLETLLKYDASDAAAQNRIGRLRFAKGDEKGAFAAFKAAADADKQALPAEMVMAMLWVDRDQARAEKWLEHAIKLNNDARTQVGAANYMLKTNRLDQAKGYAAKAVELDPEGFDSNFIAGIAARMDGDYAKADQYLSRAHLLQPANVDVMNHLALSLVELPEETRKARALQYAQIIASQNPNNPNIMATLGWVNYRLKRADDARRAFNAVFNSKEVRDTQTMTSEMGYYLAHLAKEQGNSEEAIKMLREALNTEQPFAYRKMAQQFLDELTKAGGGAAAKTGTTPTTK